MENIELFYKIYFCSEKEEIIEKKPYYYINININKNKEENKKKKKKKESIKDKIIEDGYNPNYFNFITEWKYFIRKSEENSPKILLEDLKVLDSEEIEFEGKGSFELYLHLILNSEKYEKERKKEAEEEKNKEEYDIKAQYSNIEQISNELYNMKKQIQYVKLDIQNEHKEMIKSIKENIQKVFIKNKFNNSKTMIFQERKTALNLKKSIPINSTDISHVELSQEKNQQNIIISKDSSNIDDNLEIDNNENIDYSKIFFLFSSPLKQNEQFIIKDYSYYNNALKIYNTLKNISDVLVEFHLKQIKENLFLDKEPDILHLRIDSIKKDVDGQIFFKWGSKNCIDYSEYSLNNLINAFKNKKNLKLLILSSQYIEEIKKELQLKDVNIIYINNSKEKESKENKFIQQLYENLFSKESNLREYYQKIDEDFKDFCYFDIKNENKCFDREERNKEPEFIIDNQNMKNILSFEMMKNDYCIFGRNEELYQSIKKITEIDNVICIFGEKGVGKKSFAKKLGFESYERNIVDKIYFLEISSIDNENPELKINMYIEDIENYYSNNNSNLKIMLIIYFNEPVYLIHILKDIIFKCKSSKKKNINITYLFTFTIDDIKLKEIANDFPNSFELTNFNIYEKEKSKFAGLKNIFTFYSENKNFRNKYKFIEAINNIFNELIKKDENKNEIIISDDDNEKIKKDNSKDIENKEEINKINLDKNEVNDVKLEKLNKEDNLKKVKINNIILFLSIFNFRENFDEIKNIFYKLIIEDEKEIKKKIIFELIDSTKKDKKEQMIKLFLYLIRLNSGIGKSTLKLLLDDNNEEIIKLIKEKLYGLIVSEYNNYEEIYRLDSSYKKLIEEILKEKELLNEEIMIKIDCDIMKNYFMIFRNILEKYNFPDEEGFHACIQNYFWFNQEAKKKYSPKEDNCNFNINIEIDSDNIYNIIKNLKKEIYDKNKEIQIYIDDISISLPTLLYCLKYFYTAYLIISLFEKYFDHIKDLENEQKINGLILRLGIFKYWISKNPNFFQKSLESINLLDNRRINLDKEAKIEYYLAKIYDCIIKGDKNIEEYYSECNSILKNEQNNINKKRLKKLNDKAISLIEQNPKNKFYFILKNPLEKEFKTELNTDFYLTQKLLTIIPSNFGIEFKTFGKQNNEHFKKYLKGLKTDSPRIGFFYLENVALKEKFVQFLEKNKEKLNIKILIINFADDIKKYNKENFINFKEQLKKLGTKNIIYIVNEDNFLNKLSENSNYNNKSYYYYFEIYFFQFIHEFISLITSKYNYCSIEKAFNKAKRNFVSKFVQLFEDKEFIKNIENMIKMDSLVEDDTFEIEYIEKECNLNNHQKIINDIYDEYENEYNKVKNIYYSKNPFSEESEKKIKKVKYKKYMKLPGIDNLNPKNFLNFIENGNFEIENNIIEYCVDKIDKNNIFNVYGEKNVWQLGDELCKYLYMVGKFSSGIYIVSPRDIKDNLDFLMENMKLNEEGENHGKEILILFKIFNIIENNDINEILNSLTKKGVHILICSQDKIDLKDISFESYKLEK